MAQQDLRILLKDGGDGNAGNLLGDRIQRAGSTAHVELDLARRQQRPSG
jgi:hypothetical protein